MLGNAGFHDDGRINGNEVHPGLGSAEYRQLQGVCSGIHRTNDGECRLIASFDHHGVPKEDRGTTNAGGSLDVGAVGLERARFEDHDGLQRRIRAICNGEADVVGLSALHCAFGGELYGISVLTQHVVAHVVDVVSTVGDVVYRADGDGELGVRIRDLSEVDGIVGIGSVNPRTVEEEAEDVVVLRVDPFEVFIGSEHIIESDGVSRGDKVEFDDADVVDTAHIEILADERGYAVGDVQQVGITRHFLTVHDHVIEASAVDIGRVVGHFRAQDESTFDGEFIGVETGDVSNLHRASGELDVDRLDALTQQDVIDILLRSECAVDLELRIQFCCRKQNQACCQTYK